jgi:FAS-associated factor 2
LASSCNTSGYWLILLAAVAKTIIPNSILSILPRLLVPPASQGRLLPSSRAKPFVQSLREDYTPSPVDRDQIPDFYSGSYKEFLRGIRSDPKLGVVILCCGEHEDDAVFKREVLLNEELGRVFREKDIAVWGGDVREREAYQGSSRLAGFDRAW